MSLTPEWAAELRRIGAGGAGLGLVGWLVGEPAWVLLAGAVGYLGWHLVQLYRLEEWLRRRPDREPPDTPGAWSSVRAELIRLRRQNRKRKKRLRKAIARFRQAAEASPDGNVILGPDDAIVWSNHGAARLLGLRYPQDRGQPVSNLVRAPKFASYLERGAFEEPLEIVSPLDESFQLLVRVVPYGKDRRLIVVRDVTRVKKLEQMRRDFVANVSHELRSPLTVIVGYLESLEDDASAPAEWRRPIEQMSQQAGRMCLIVEDLLRLSRIENDPGGAARIPVSVAAMLESVRADALRLGDGSHRIAVEADPALTLLGSYNELYSAFSNVAFNAVQYTPSGGEITLRWHAGADGTARLEITDTGVGIDPHHVPRLTERFYRVDKARSREVGGTGLGLAIVKHVLVRHDALLEIESELGGGSTFACCFPASRVVRSQQPAQVAAS